MVNKSKHLKIISAAVELYAVLVILSLRFHMWKDECNVTQLSTTKCGFVKIGGLYHHHHHHHKTYRAPLTGAQRRRTIVQ